MAAARRPVETRQDFEERLETASLLVRTTRRWHAPMVDAILDRGNPKVVFGRKNWLFYREAVNYVTGSSIGSDRALRSSATPEALADPVATIVDFLPTAASRHSRVGHRARAGQAYAPPGTPLGRG